jgi:hypothetical protein
MAQKGRVQFFRFRVAVYNDQTANADAGATVGATVKFYALQVSH